MKRKPKGGNLSNKLNEILAKRKLNARFGEAIELAVEIVTRETRATYDPDVKKALYQILEIKSRLKDHMRVPVFIALAVCCFFAVVFQPPAGELLDIVLAFEFCLVASVLTHDAVNWNLEFEKDRSRLAGYEKFLDKFSF